MSALIQMFNDLDSHRLEVQLVPLNPRLRNWSEYGMKRVVTDMPPRWYRLMCQRHTSSREIRRGKQDTRVRRQNILRVLSRLVNGLPVRSKYAPEILRVAESRST